MKREEKCSGKSLMAFLLAGIISWSVIPDVLARDSIAPDQVVDDFLASLIKGDTQSMRRLMSGRMQDRSRQLALHPDTYSQFLQKHYAGVETIVEELREDGDHLQAHIRFHYPNSTSTDMIFVLRQIDGQWKITDEIF